MEQSEAIMIIKCSSCHKALHKTISTDISWHYENGFVVAPKIFFGKDVSCLRDVKQGGKLSSSKPDVPTRDRVCSHTTPTRPSLLFHSMSTCKELLESTLKQASVSCFPFSLRWFRIALGPEKHIFGQLLKNSSSL